MALAPLWAERVQTRVSGGLTAYVDDGADNHGTVGGSVRFYLTRRWSVEPEYLFQTNNVFNSHSDQVFWGNVAYDFRDREKKAIPYWFAAPGVIHSRTRFGSSTFTNTELAGSTGAGARFHITDRIFVGPQVRFGIADSFFAEVTGSIGFVIKK